MFDLDCSKYPSVVNSGHGLKEQAGEVTRLPSENGDFAQVDVASAPGLTKPLTRGKEGSRYQVAPLKAATPGHRPNPDSCVSGDFTTIS